MDHDLTTAPGAVAADGLQPGGPAPGGTRAGAGAPGPAGPAGASGPAGSAGPAGAVTTVRLASPGSVIASVPFLFGFHPDNSLVVLGVSHSAEAGSFIRHGVRIDLDQVRGHERTTALELAARLRDQDADIAILVAFGPRSATGAKARPDHCRKLMAAFRAQLEAAASEERVTVVDALYTANGRWWSYMCRNSRCCPSGGTVVPAEAPAALAGAFAARGHTVYASREALDAALDPYPAEVLARTAAAAEHLDPTWYDTDGGLADARRLMDVLLARCGTDAGEQASRAPRPEGPRAGRRGLSDSVTAALAARPPAGAAGLSTEASSSSSERSDSDPDGASADGASAVDESGVSDDAAATRSGQSRLGKRPASSNAADPDGAETEESAGSATSSPGSARSGSSASSTGATSSGDGRAAGTVKHSTGAVIPAARSGRRVSNRVPPLNGKSDGVPLGAPAEPPGSLLAPPVMSDAEAAELLIALLNWRVRDYLACAAATVDSAGRLLRLGAELARRAPHPELRLAPYALAAWAAWAIGRPAIAQCAVDRALAIDPEYKFASLIRAGLHHAIDGEGVRESAASTRRDLFGEDTPAGEDAVFGSTTFDDAEPGTASAPIPSPRSTEPVPTQSGTDLEIP